MRFEDDFRCIFGHEIELGKNSELLERHKFFKIRSKARFSLSKSHRHPGCWFEMWRHCGDVVCMERRLSSPRIRSFAQQKVSWEILKTKNQKKKKFFEDLSTHFFFTREISLRRFAVVRSLVSPLYFTRLCTKIFYAHVPDLSDERFEIYIHTYIYILLRIFRKRIITNTFPHHHWTCWLHFPGLKSAMQ